MNKYILTVIKPYSAIYLIMMAYIVISFGFNFVVNYSSVEQKTEVISVENAKGDYLKENLEVLQKSNPLKLFLVGFFFMVLFSLGVMLNIILFIFYLIDKNKFNSSVFWTDLDIGWHEFIRGVILFLFLNSACFDLQKLFKGNLWRAIFLVVDTLGIYLVMSIFFYFTLRVQNKNLQACFGLLLKNFKKHFFLGWASYLGFMPYFVILVLVTLNICQFLGFPLKAHPIIGYFKKETSSFITIYLTVFAMFIAPIVEELLFRGIIFKLISKRINLKASVLVTAILFALLHFNLSQFIPIVALGIVLNVLYIKTDSLIPAITFHVVNNSVALILTHLIIV